MRQPKIKMAKAASEVTLAAKKAARLLIGENSAICRASAAEICNGWRNAGVTYAMAGVAESG